MPKKSCSATDKNKENNKIVVSVNQPPLKFDTVHHFATNSQVLSADLILLFVLVAIVYFSSSRFVSTVFHIRENIKLIYEGFKTGKFHYDCTIGGSAIQIAECQIYHGFNVFLFYTVTYFLEYTSLIFRGSNVVEVFGRVAGLFCMVKLLIWNIPFSFLFQILRSTLCLLRQMIIFAVVYVTPSSS